MPRPIEENIFFENGGIKEIENADEQEYLGNRRIISQWFPF